MSKRIVAMLAAASLALAGCATTGTGQPLTANQKIARCAGMVVVGAVLGTIIGNNTGRGRAGQGAAIGAGLGGAACAVWMAFENQRDRERLAQMQLAAASSGQTQTQSWQGEGADTRMRDASVSVSTQTEMLVPGETQERRVCRNVTTTVGLTGAEQGISAGRQSDTINEVWCRGTDGVWAAAPGATPATGPA